MNSGLYGSNWSDCSTTCNPTQGRSQDFPLGGGGGGGEVICFREMFTSGRQTGTHQ